MIFADSDVFNTRFDREPEARAQKVVVRCVRTVHAAKNAGKAAFLVVAFCGGPSVDHGLSPNSYSVAPRFAHALHYVNPLIIVWDKGGVEDAGEKNIPSNEFVWGSDILRLEKNVQV